MFCNSSAFPLRLPHTYRNTHTEMQKYTQKQAGEKDSGRRSYLWTLAARNESDFHCSQWLSGADSLSALCVSTEGFEALPQLDSRATHLQMFSHIYNTHIYAAIAATTLQGWLQQSWEKEGGRDAFEVLTQYRDLVYWGLWVVSGWYTASQPTGRRTELKERVLSRTDINAQWREINSLQAREHSLWLLQRETAPTVDIRKSSWCPWHVKLYRSTEF